MKNAIKIDDTPAIHSEQSCSTDSIYQVLVVGYTDYPLVKEVIDEQED